MTELSKKEVKQIVHLYRQGDQVTLIAHKLGVDRKAVVSCLQGKSPRGDGCLGVESRFRELTCKNDHTPEELAFIESEIEKAKAEVQASWDATREWSAAGRPKREYDIMNVDDSMPRR